MKEIFGGLPRHIKYVAMDFAKDNLLTQLRKGGYQPARKTLFIWEGVTRYLPEAAVLATLRFVRDHAAAGSTISFERPLPCASQGQIADARCVGAVGVTDGDLQPFSPEFDPQRSASRCSPRS